VRSTSGSSGLRAKVEAVRYLMVAAALVAAYYSIVLARADYLFGLDTPNSVSAAVRLVPSNFAYVVRLAAWEPDERQTLLRRAVDLNPFDYESLIQLGLLSEMQDGDPTAAERYYLRASQVDHMFLPGWTLTNFYFRRQNQSEFFRWARQTLLITPYASDAIFTQMWLLSQDAGQLDALIPDRPKALLQYASFLANSGHFEGVARSVRRLQAAIGKADPRAWGRDDLIATATDQILTRGDTYDALRVWRVLKDGGWIQQSVPDAEHPLTNGDFRLPLFRHGFDWAPLTNSGVRVNQSAHGGMQISLNGDQPEHCVLLQQYIAAQPDTAYLLKWKATSSSAVAGLAWHLRNQSSGDLLASEPNWKVRITSSPQPLALSLEYTRPAGQVRSSGSVSLDWVTMIRR
jgi:tetratricopeptide (TPR) repeat protein